MFGIRTVQKHKHTSFHSISYKKKAIKSKNLFYSNSIFGIERNFNLRANMKVLKQILKGISYNYFKGEFLHPQADLILAWAYLLL